MTDRLYLDEVEGFVVWLREGEYLAVDLKLEHERKQNKIVEDYGLKEEVQKENKKEANNSKGEYELSQKERGRIEQNNLLNQKAGRRIEENLLNQKENRRIEEEKRGFGDEDLLYEEGDRERIRKDILLSSKGKEFGIEQEKLSNQKEDRRIEEEKLEVSYEKGDNIKYEEKTLVFGKNRKKIEEAEAGDIIAISGLPDISVGETVCELGKEDALPHLRIDEPTLQMTFGVNTSPFVGRDGKIVTARKIEERLNKETERDVSLKIAPNDSESFIVSGRGELHLSILIENMRREGFELQVSKPEVIIKEIDGVKCEPYEDVQIDVPEEYVGNVIEALGNREGKMENMSNYENQVRLNYTIPSRGLIGFSTEFMTMTKGYGIINHTFKEYAPLAGGTVGERKLGVLVSMENGKSTAYALGGLEDRGIMFVEPGEDIYEGMIVGEHTHENDLAVNVVKGKNLTNTRSAGKDHTVVLKRPRLLTLEYCLDYINSDEYVEVTPNHLRLRKKILNINERKAIEIENGKIISFSKDLEKQSLIKKIKSKLWR